MRVVTEDHAIAVRDWRVQSTKPEREQRTAETVVKLSLKKDTPKIEVTMEPDEESNYTPEEKATYQKIKDYVKDKYGVNVSSLYIAQIKDKCVLDKERTDDNSDNKYHVPRCPKEKEEVIMDAFRYYGLIGGDENDRK